MIMTHAEILGKITLNYCVFSSPSRFSNASAFAIDMNEALFFFAPDMSNVKIEKVVNGESVYRFVSSEKHVFRLADKEDSDKEKSSDRIDIQKVKE